MDAEQTDGGRPKRSGWKDVLTTWVPVASVLVLGVGLIITNNANREQQKANLKQLTITERGQVTDRFGRAIDQLGSGKLGGMVKSCGRRVLIDHAATLFSASSGRSMSTPFSNFAPARTRATRCGPLT